MTTLLVLAVVLAAELPLAFLMGQRVHPDPKDYREEIRILRNILHTSTSLKYTCDFCHRSRNPSKHALGKLTGGASTLDPDRGEVL